MRASFILAILLALLLGCKDNPGDSDSFTPYQIGTWLVESPEQARWIGQQPMQKASPVTTQGDTVEITSPDNQLIQIIRSDGSNWSNPSPNRGYFDFVIRDSSLTAADSVTFRHTRFEFPSSGGWEVDVGGRESGIYEDHIFSKLHSSMPCNVELNGHIVVIHYRTDDGDHVATYRIIANGFTDVLNEIAC